MNENEQTVNLDNYCSLLFQLSLMFRRIEKGFINIPIELTNF